MKKILVVLSIILVVLALTACAKSVPQTVVPVVTDAPVVVEVPTCSCPTVAPVVCESPTTMPTENNNPLFYISDWRVTGVPEGEVLYASQPFSRTVIIFNGGQSEWGKDFKLVWVGGDKMKTEDVQILQKVKPGEFAQVNINLTAPGDAGTYTSWWLLETEKGVRFGSGYDGNRVIAITITVK